MCPRSGYWCLLSVAEKKVPTCEGVNLFKGYRMSWLEDYLNTSHHKESLWKSLWKGVLYLAAVFVIIYFIVALVIGFRTLLG